MVESASGSRWAAWILACSVVLLFGPSVFGDFTWDDLPVIRDNELLHSFEHAGRLFRDDFWTVSDAGVSFASGYFRPVVKGAWLLLWVATGGAAWAFHGLNVLLHLAVTLLAVGFVARRAQLPAWSTAAVLGAAVFAFHPARVESVGWIVGATDLWLGLFVLLAAWAWDRVDGARGVLLAAVFVVLAFFSKESALLWPVVLAIELASGSRNNRVHRSWGSLAVVSGTLGAAWALRSLVVPIRSMEGPSSLADVAARVLGTVGYYTRVLLLPVEPSVLSGDTGLDAKGVPLVPPGWVALGGVVVAAALVAVVFAWRMGRRDAVADLAWFVVFVAPVLNVTPLGYSMLGSERFLYLPSLGLSVLVARLVLRVSGTTVSGLRWPVIGVVATCVLWSSLSFAHVLRLGDERALWLDARERHPESTYAADLLARALWVEGDVEGALPHALFAAKSSVDGPARLRSIALWHQIAVEQGGEVIHRKAAAFCRFVRETETVTTADFEGVTYRFDPAWVKDVRASAGFLSACSIAFAETGDFVRAESLLRAWLASEPGRLSATVNLVRVLAAQGRMDEAGRERDAALARTGDPEARAILQAIDLRSVP